MNHRCESWNRFLTSRCGKVAKYYEVGKWYCGLHAPSIIIIREKARQETRKKRKLSYHIGNQE